MAFSFPPIRNIQKPVSPNISVLILNPQNYLLDRVLGVLQKIDAINHILCVSRVELHDFLGLVEGQEVDDDGLAADDPLDGLGAGRGGERASVSAM